MNEKGLFGSFEHLGPGLIELAVGIGAIALGVRFFKNSFGQGKEKSSHK